MEISFKDILQIIKKNLVFIIITSLVFAAGSYFVTRFFIQKTYTATVKLYVETTHENVNSQYDLSSVSYAQKLVATYIEMLDTNNFYSSVSNELNEKYTASQISSMVKFTGITDTEIFTASVVTTSPTEAKNIADAVAKCAPEKIASANSNAALKIIDEAAIPKTPTSPSTSKNMTIALIIGLVLSLIISFIRDYFDVKIKYNEDMTTLCDLPVLSAIPDFEYFATNKTNKKEYKH